jgi:hypothetical protein
MCFFHCWLPESQFYYQQFPCFAGNQSQGAMPMSKIKVYAASCLFLIQDQVYVAAENVEEALRKAESLEDLFPLHDGEPAFDEAMIHREMPTFLLRRKIPLTPEQLGEDNLPNEIRLVSRDPDDADAPLQGDVFYIGLLVTEDGKLSRTTFSFSKEEWDIIAEGSYPLHLSLIIQTLQKRYARWEEQPLPCNSDVEEVVYLLGMADALIGASALSITEGDQHVIETLIAQMVNSRWEPMPVAKEPDSVRAARIVEEGDANHA